MFKELLILTRSLNLMYHHMHNTCKGTAFFADHAELNSMYEALDSDYDSLAERRLGLTSEFSRDSLSEILHESAVLVSGMPDEDVMAMFEFAQSMESNYRNELKAAEMGQSSGTVNMLQGLADQSEVRSYKLQRRLK